MTWKILLVCPSPEGFTNSRPFSFQASERNTIIAMNLLDELDSMAISAAYEDPEEEDDPSKATVKMWQERFGYSHEQAADLVRITKTIKQPASE